MMAATELHREKFRDFTPVENQTWGILFNNLVENRRSMACKEFTEGLDYLGITGSHIPDLEEVNRRLMKKTGWKGVPVTGLESGDSFYPSLARRSFRSETSSATRIRSVTRRRPTSFTISTAIFPSIRMALCDVLRSHGKMASKYIGDPAKLQKLERFFWFTIEFGLIETPVGRRIFGAGILSSRDESVYSLSDKPEVLPFNVQTICAQDYRIDQIQPRLFVLKTVEDLYSSIPAVEAEVLKT